MNRTLSILLILLSLVLLAACSSPEEGIVSTVPAPKIAEEDLIEMFAEIHLVESITALPKLKTDSSKRYNRHELYRFIYQKYDVDSPIIDSILLYYGEHPDDFKPLYEKVRERLEELEKEYKRKDKSEDEKSKDNQSKEEKSKDDKPRLK